MRGSPGGLRADLASTMNKPVMSGWEISGGGGQVTEVQVFNPKRVTLAPKWDESGILYKDRFSVHWPSNTRFLFVVIVVVFMPKSAMPAHYW